MTQSPEATTTITPYGTLVASYSGTGITSKKPIEVRLKHATPGTGILFRTPDREGNTVEIPATAASVVNTLRNVTVGKGTARLCIVEHVLCAVGLWGLSDLIIEVDGPELPLEDGSAAFWLELLDNSPEPRRAIAADLTLKEPITVSKGDRVLMAIPDTSFSMTYLFDMDHPAIGKRWQTWSPEASPLEIAFARTFGSLKEHKLLGLVDKVVSYTETGFSEPLRFTDEPVRHKLLDLFGDLMLAGVNPQRWKARFIAIKSGHEMDVQMATKLATLIK